MSERKRIIRFHIDGHAGHSGNVLAHAFIDKFKELLDTLAALERAYTDRGQRASDFEIIELSKKSPACAAFRATPKIQDYNPAGFMDWAYDQYEAVATGTEPDRKVDSDIAKRLEDFAKQRADHGYSRIWIDYDEDRAIDIDDGFAAKAGKLVSERLERPELRWYAGESLGKFRGRLGDVADGEGQHEFYITPPGQADSIACKFAEDLRDDVKKLLFDIVEVEGILHYDGTGPRPKIIEAAKIVPVPEGPALADMEGLLADSERGEGLDVDFWEQ